MIIERRIDDEGRFRTDEQRVAVARLVGDIFRRDLIIGAGLVLDHHLRAEISDEMLREQPPEHIGDAAR